MVALEDAAGADPMRSLLASIVRQPSRVWDYPTLREAALAAGISRDVWERFEAECVPPPFATGCLARYADRE